MAEQVVGVVPALAFLADAVCRRHAHILEDDAVERMLAVDGDDRLDRDPRCLHVDQQEADALLLLFLVARAQQAENPVGMLPEAGPYFRAVDDIVAAVGDRACLQRGKVGARSRFGVALRPENGAVENAGQETLLLVLGAEGVDDGPHIKQPHRHDVQRARALKLLVEDILLVGAPAGAAIGFRPVDGEPALGRHRALRCLVVLFRRRSARRHLLHDRARIFVFEEVPHLHAELFVFFGEGEVHVSIGSALPASVPSVFVGAVAIRVR